MMIPAERSHPAAPLGQESLNIFDNLINNSIGCGFDLLIVVAHVDHDQGYKQFDD